MVIRLEAVQRRLARLEEILSTLSGLDYDPSQADKAWNVERGLQLAAECVFDVGNHLLSAHFGTAADGYEQILDALAQRGVIDDALRADLAGLGGFRNVLVHGYLELDPDRVRDAHQLAPRVFSEYRVQVERWIDEHYGFNRPA